jgi:hypothetical protein
MTEMTLPQFLNALAEAKREGKITMDPFHGFGGATQLRLRVTEPLKSATGADVSSLYSFCPVAALVAVETGEHHSNSEAWNVAHKIGLDRVLAIAVARAADEYNDRCVGQIYNMSSLRTQLEAALKS